MDFVVISASLHFFSVISNKPHLHGREMKGWARFSVLMSKVPNKAQLIYRQTDKDINHVLKINSCSQFSRARSREQCAGNIWAVRTVLPIPWTCVSPVMGVCCLCSHSSHVYLLFSPSWPDMNGFETICSCQKCDSITGRQTGLQNNSSEKQEICL